MLGKVQAGDTVKCGLESEGNELARLVFSAVDQAGGRNLGISSLALHCILYSLHMLASRRANKNQALNPGFHLPMADLITATAVLR